MSDKPTPSLRVVPYDPEDFSLKSALTPEHGTVLEESSMVSAVLSLYFQWPEYREASLVCERDGESVPLKCELDYDRDEREPSEMRVLFEKKEDALTFKQMDRVKFRLSVFYIGYLFECEVLAVDPDRSFGWDFVISIPRAIVVQKLRRLPRIKIRGTANESIAPVMTWDSGGTSSLLGLIEMGLQSVRVDKVDIAIGTIGSILIDGKKFGATVVRHGRNNESIFKFMPETSKEYGAYFDIYARVAYPSLRSKFDYPLEAGVDLYKRTGFFEKFSKGLTEEEIKSREQELFKTWDGVKSGFHETTADYYVVDPETVQPIGAASLSLGFHWNETPVWVFHQLCMTTEKKYLAQTSELYRWRTEYLFGKKEHLDAIIWFDGKSRWIDRIWVKFASFGNGTLLHNVKIRWLKCEKRTDASPSPNLVPHVYKIGEMIRHDYSKDNTHYSAWGPSLLNSAGGLDTIVDLSDNPVFDELSDKYSEDLELHKKDHGYIRLTYRGDVVSEKIDSLLEHASNRHCQFKKNAMTDLLAAIEHSIAIIQRKVA